MEVDLRKEYQPHQEMDDQKLFPNTAPDHPADLFLKWYKEAIKGSRIKNLGKERIGEIEIYEPYAMVLSTVSTDHRPHSRVVLMREFTRSGLVFYTNYHSAKGRQMESRPYAAANFFWPPLDRQVRIEGMIEKTTAKHSQRYFESRPSGSRIAAAISHQSEILTSREDLIASLKDYSEPPPCPDHWGGYILIPDYFEFWLGRQNRLHERLGYRLSFPKNSNQGNDQKMPSWEKFLLYP